MLHGAGLRSGDRAGRRRGGSRSGSTTMSWPRSRAGSSEGEQVVSGGATLARPAGQQGGGNSGRRLAACRHDDRRLAADERSDHFAARADAAVPDRRRDRDGAQGCRSRHPPGRAGRHHRPVGLGQVDADEHPRLPRPARPRAPTSSPAAMSASWGRTSWRSCGASISASSSSATSCCPISTRSRMWKCRRSMPASTARARRKRAIALLTRLGLGERLTPPAQRAVGRPAAARQRGAGADERRRGDPGRRADRRARLAAAARS